MKRRPGSFGKSSVLPVIGLLLAFVLLWISVPNFVAGAAMTVGDITKSAYFASAKPDQNASSAAQELADWRASREWALEWADIPDAHADLSDIYLLEAGEEPDLTLRYALIEAARDHAIDAVAGDPTDGFLWMRLGRLDVLTQQPAETALAALHASLETAPYQPSLLGPRLRFGFKYWPVVSEALRTDILEQLRFLVVAGNLQQIDRLVRENPFYVPVIRAQFEGSDALQRRIDRISSE